MKKQDKRHKAPAEPPSEGMSIDAILERLADLKDVALFLQKPRDDPDITESRVTACEAATDILTALQDEGIMDHEQVRDLFHDYNALAEQYRGLHQKYEVEDKPVRLGNAFICPACNRQLRQLYTAHCWNCGKRLSWGR